MRSRTLSCLIAILTLASCTLLSACGLLGGGPSAPDIPPEAPDVVSLDPQNWYIFYSAQMPSHPETDGEGAWSFEFPSSGTGGHVNYVQTPFNATTTLHNVNVTFKVESVEPQYVVIDPTDIPPATVHIFFEQQNSSLSDANGRWWAGPSQYNLGSKDNTIVSFSVPLTPDQWSNVYGQRDSKSFYAALANVGWIGVTFGGQYFWGHGVALASGSAKYILIGFQVN
jgi:hypothetical protein